MTRVLTKGSNFPGARIWVLPVVAATLMLAWTSTPGAAAGGERYRVRAGDTLTALAARHRTTVGALVRLNNLDPMGVLPIGVVLTLPERRAPERLERYVVRYGDTLSQIASLHGTDVEHIARINHLDPEGVLLKGQRLLLPEGPRRQAIRASIRRWADHYRIPRPLALALAWQESGHQADVVSKAGAIGVMQVMPDTWAYVQRVLIGRPIPHTPDGNVRVGLAYLRHLLNLFGNTQRALAAYLQGDESVRTDGIHRSTRRYIANILAIAGRTGDPSA